MPAGIDTTSFRWRRSRPDALQLAHGSVITLPAPRHRPQADTWVNCPNMLWWLRRTSPAPAHSRQTVGDEPGSLPPPLHREQTSVRRTSIGRSQPKTASSKSTVSDCWRSPPRLADVRDRAEPPPKKASKMSPNPPKVSKPSNPCAPFCPSPAWPKRSYADRFSRSESTWYASLISLKRSVAPSFLFRSGWNSSASFLNAFFSSSSEQPRETPRTS